MKQNLDIEEGERKPIILSGEEDIEFLEWYCQNFSYVLERLKVVTVDSTIVYERCLMPREMVE